MLLVHAVHAARNNRVSSSAQAGGRSRFPRLRFSFFLPRDYLCHINVALNETLEAKHGRKARRRVHAHNTRRGRGRGRATAILSTRNTNYRLSGRPLTRLVDSRHSLFRPLGCVYSLFAAHGIHGHARLSFSLESRSFSADRAPGPHSLRSRCLCGETRQSFRGHIEKSTTNFYRRPLERETIV